MKVSRCGFRSEERFNEGDIEVMGGRDVGVFN